MMYFFVDVDGTLIDTQDQARPFTEGLLAIASMPGYKSETCRLVIWSSGGADYAAEKIKCEYAFAYMQKSASFVYEQLFSGHTCFVVDDDMSFLQDFDDYNTGYIGELWRWWVPFWNSDPEDHQLEKLIYQISEIKSYG